VWETNDFFGIFFAAISMALIAYGWNREWGFVYAGLGMAAYGAAYFLLHDVLSHGRYGLRIKARGIYLRSILRSHRVHHAGREKRGCISFGFLWPLNRSALQRFLHTQKGRDKAKRVAKLSA
jgi:beta-carotene 3-hydroxylase